MIFFSFPNRRVLIAGAAASTTRAIIETPLELAKVLTLRLLTKHLA